MPRQPDTSNYTDFGRRLEATRTSRTEFRSQAAFARALKVSPQGYGSWLIGKGHPSVEGLSTLRRITKVDLNYLITGEVPVAEVPALTVVRNNRRG